MVEKKVAALLAAVIAVTGCATGSKDIATAYVSPIQYQNYDCSQIGLEAQRLTGRMQQLGGRLDEAASNDRAIVGVGVVLFWPALFALGGTKQQEAEYARLKGEAEALQQAAVARKCVGMNPETPQTIQGPKSALTQPNASESIECVRQGLRVGDKVAIPGMGDVVIKEVKTSNTHCPGTGGNTLPVVVSRELPPTPPPLVLVEPPTVLAKASGQSVVERLRDLKKLREENLITQEAYESKQREILASQ